SDPGQAPAAGPDRVGARGDPLGGVLVDEDGDPKELGHRLQPGREVDLGPVDADLGLVVRPEAAGDGAATGDPDPALEVGRAGPLLLGRLREPPTDGQGRPRGPTGLVVVGNRPAPEAHGRVALEVADDPALVDDAAGHDPQRLADAVPEAGQVVLV